MKMKNRALLTMGVSISLVMALAMPVSATGKGNSLQVGSGQEFDTIQDAVNAAKQGSKILVYPGHYVENVLITTNNLQIIAQGDEVIVEATPPPPHAANASGVFYVLADHVTIRGFEIWYGARCAPGIEFQGSHNTFAENSLYLHATCLGANAITCRDGDGGSDYNIIEHNYIDQADLGIVISALGKNQSTPDAINTGNVIRNNTTRSIGQLAIGVENGKGFLVSGNRIEEVSFGHCMAIGSHGEDASAQGHHTIENNTMGYCAGNGISLYAWPETILTHNRIADNTIQNCGSDCLALEAGSGAVMTDNKVTGNEASFSAICGITLGAYPWDAPDTSVSNNLVRDNTVYRNLSGVCLNPKADNNLLLKNVAQNQTTDGIVVFGDGNKLLSNSAHDNDVNGIEVSGDNNAIFNNIALQNGLFDLADEGTDNRWRNNTYETKSW